MRALVTGGAGFIGSHLVDSLLGDGHSVAVLDDLSTGRRTNLSLALPQVTFHQGDVRSPEDVGTALEGCEVVFHLAALPSVPRSIDDPLASNATNVNGTLNVLVAARDAGVRRVVFASSSSVYGPGGELPKHEGMPTRPVSPYAASKLAGESYARAFFEVYGLETVSLRFFNVFGPRQDPHSPYAAVIPRFIAAALEGRPATVFGDGRQSRDFTYVGNAVQAVTRAAHASGVAGLAFNVACGQRVSLERVLSAIAAATGTEIEPERRPPRPGEVRHSLADVSFACELLGYRPAIDFDAGLALTLEASRSPAGELALT